MATEYILQVTHANRLDCSIKEHLKCLYTKNDIHWSIEHNRCRVNGKIERFASTRVQKGDTIVVSMGKKPQYVFEPHRVLKDTSQWLAYDKPPGIHTEKLAALFGLKLVHRLDRDTSGILILAKTEQSKKAWEERFRKREIIKQYSAIVVGSPIKKSGRIRNYMSCIKKHEGATIWGVVDNNRGVYSETFWKWNFSKGNLSFVTCFPKTGRTHQIRVHLQYIGLPILGDVVYGKREQPPNVFRPYLHASNLTCGDINIHSPLPQDWPVEFK